MKKTKILFLFLVALTTLFLVSCANPPTPEDNPSNSEEILISIDYAPDEIPGEYNSFVDEYVGYEAERIMLSTNIATKDFKFIEIGYNEKNEAVEYFESSVLYSLDKLLPEAPLVVNWLEQGTIPHRGISFMNENNLTRYFYITKSGENGAPLLVEF